MKRVSSLLFGTRSWPEHYILILQMSVSSPSGPTCFSRWVLHSPATPHFSLVPQQACTSIVHCLCLCGSFCLPGMSFLPRTAWQTLTHRSRPKLNVTFPVMPSSAVPYLFSFLLRSLRTRQEHLLQQSLHWIVIMFAVAVTKCWSPGGRDEPYSFLITLCFKSM